MPNKHIVVLDGVGRVAADLQRAGLLDGFEVRICATEEEARKALAADRPPLGLIVFDSSMVEMPEGAERLVTATGTEWVAVIDPDLPQPTNLRMLVSRCFIDFHTLPLDLDRLRATLGHAYGKALLGRSVAQRIGDAGQFGMIGRSQRMLEVYRRIDKIVRVDAPVLIGGDSGTGKELVAHAIHRYSARAGGPFVALNCGAVQPNLIQTELFGYEKGAFTGAQQRKLGSIEAADGGVLFLDEIGDLPLELQGNLLRFLQEKTIVRVGATHRLRVDVRVIAATHVDLREAVRRGSFREDLFYRLNVLHIQVPRLAERPDDIPLIAQSVFREHAYLKCSQLKGFSSDALKVMCAHDWPGNVRELINRVQQAMVMSENRLITAADLGLQAGGASAGPAAGSLNEARASAEREAVENCLRRARFNVTEAARQLGVSRVTLYRMIDRLNISV
jgi:DNA-binding NtrC family response regulator